MSLWKSLRAGVAGAIAGFQSSCYPYYETTRFSQDRAQIWYYLPTDSRFYLDQWNRKEILRKVDWLYQTFGLVKEAIRGTARHTVGKGICFSLNSDDEDWNALAEADVEQYLMSPGRCDRAGRRNGYEIQMHAVCQRLKQGEFLAAFVPNPRWDDAPCVQIFDSMEIGVPDKVTDPYIVDGVRLDKDHNPLGYFVQGINNTWTEIPADQMVHWFFADATNQVRGLSDFAQAVNPLIDARELIKLTTKTAKQNSAIGMHIKKMVKAGGQGALDKIRKEMRSAVTTPAPAGTSDTVDPNYERLTGGGAIIYTAEDGDVKFLTPNSPSPLAEPFINKVLIRDAACSWGVPQEFFWEVGHLNSSSSRFIITRANLLFETLGDGLIGHLLNPWITRYLLHRLEIGALPQCKDPNWMLKFAWQLPARITLDNGRDGALEINQLANSVETLSTIQDRRGRGWRPMIDQWFREFSYAARVAKKQNVEWALKLWRPSQPGAGSAVPENGDQKEEHTEDAHDNSGAGNGGEGDKGN